MSARIWRCFIDSGGCGAWELWLGEVFRTISTRVYARTATIVSQGDLIHAEAVLAGGGSGTVTGQLRCHANRVSGIAIVATASRIFRTNAEAHFRFSNTV